jgi:WhiB family redox-sensing transcriptional regulator
VPSMAEKEQTGGDWRQRGACLEEDPELFFPISESGPGEKQIEEAKAVCGRCPVLAECRVWVLDNPRLFEYGVFAGTTPDERRAEVRRRRRGDAAGVAA